MSSVADKRVLDKFVYDACDQLDDMNTYKEMSSSLQKMTLGHWRFIFYGLLIGTGLSVIRAVRNLIVDRSQVGLLVAMAVGAAALTAIFFFIVKSVRSGGESEDEQRKLLRETASALAERLQDQQPDSDLLDRWAALC